MILSKYDITLEALQNQVDSGELTFETAEYLNDVAFEMYSDIYIDGNEFTEADVVNSTLDFKKNTKKFKKLSKEFKTAIKDGNKEKAKSIFKELKKIPDECAEIIDELSGSKPMPCKRWGKKAKPLPKTTKAKAKAKNKP